MNAPTLWSVAEAAAATNGQGQGDWRVSGVSTDSRTVQQGDLFVAIQGPKFNGHRFVADALERGAAAVMVHEHPNDLASMCGHQERESRRLKMVTMGPKWPFFGEKTHN